MNVRLALVLVCLTAAPAVFSQVLTIGPNPPTTNAGAGGTPGTQTLVDLTTPSNATGTATSASFIWSGACTNAVKVKFFHRSGNTLTFYDERGPFTTTGALQTVPLTPAVNVLAGDVIGLTQITTCANPTSINGSGATAGYVFFPTDVTGTATISSGTTVAGFFLSVGGTGVAAPSANVPALSPTLLIALLLAFAAIGVFLLKR